MLQDMMSARQLPSRAVFFFDSSRRNIPPWCGKLDVLQSTQAVVTMSTGERYTPQLVL